MKPLTLKQKRFADEYIITGNAYKSAVKAGYSEKYAKSDSSKLLENTGIKIYIDNRLEKLQKTTIATQEEVLEKLTSILRQESIENVKQINPITGQVIEYEKKPSISDVLNAGKELLKRYSTIPVDLQIEKYKAEVEKIKQQTSVDDEQDSKIADFAKALRERFAKK
ncbi:MAG: terminase small subunit [Gemella sp.]|nr:terminase small subunit [Gemella sp.]